MLKQIRLYSKSIVLDAATLLNFKSLILHHQRITSPTKWKYRIDIPRKASVLVPLVTINNESCILFTVRSHNLRSHTGEVSFPGGVKEDCDKDDVETALRETHEEILIEPSSIQVLGNRLVNYRQSFILMSGSLDTVPNKDFTMIVTPVIGYIGVLHPTQFKFNSDEVSEIFTIPISRFLKDGAMNTDLISRFNVPSWTIDGHKIWGLTAYVLWLFLKIITSETECLIRTKL